MVVCISSKPFEIDGADVLAELFQIGQRVAPKFSVDERYSQPGSHTARGN